MDITKIIIADDHDLIRQGLKSLIAYDEEYQVIAEAVNGEDALSKVNEHKPDILLLDITMPKLTGLDILNEIRHISKDTKVIIVSVHKSEPYIAKALSLGVKGYLIKDKAAEDLLPALAKVKRGDIFLSDAISTILADNIAKQVCGKEEKLTLTPREKEILRLVAEGKTAKQISDALFISPRTVENNKNSLLKKFGLHRTVDLVRYAVENKLID